MSNTRKAGRRERLLARRRPSTVYQFAVEDDAEAVAELNAAKDAHNTAEFRTDDDAEQAVTEAGKRLTKARRAVEACYEPVTLTALPPAEFEALIAKPQHAPREGKSEQWNPDTFPRACFLACVDTADLSADEWEAFIDGSLSQGERDALFLAAVGVNARWPSGSIPNV
jgi:hypothetical protein